MKTYMSLYVCMYVCMYVCVCACMHSFYLFVTLHIFDISN